MVQGAGFEFFRILEMKPKNRLFRLTVCVVGKAKEAYILKKNSSSGFLVF